MRLVITATFLILLTATPAFADCLLSATAVCNGVSCANATRPVGTVVFNGDYNVVQVCRADGWRALGPGFLDPCAGSPAAGTVCGDGSVYAGLSPDGNVKMYTTRCDAGQTWNGSACTGTRLTLCWNNCNGTGYVTTSAYAGTTTGEANTTGVAALDSDSATGGFQDHVAAVYCNSLSQDGQTDWYLPASDELNVIYGNKTAIGNFDTSGSVYWSSRQNIISDANYQRFSDGYKASANKDTGRLVRCARR